MSLNDLSGGLNSRVIEVEPDDLFEEVVPGELPELKESLNVIAVLENRYNDLLDLKRDIEKSRGMNQGFALEAEKLLPGFGGVPVGFYSKDTTVTRYQVSLEEINVGLWSIIAAAAIAIMVAIKKLINWLTNNKDGKSSPASIKNNQTERENDWKNQAEDALTTGELIEELNHSANSFDLTLTDSHNNKKRYRNIDDIIKGYLTDDEKFSRAKLFLTSEDPFLHDLIKGGDYLKTVEETERIFSGSLHLFELRIKLLKQVVMKDIDIVHAGSFQARMENDHTLKTIEKPFVLPYKGNNLTFSEFGHAMNDRIHLVRSSRVQNDLTFEEVLPKLQEIYTRPGVKSILVTIANYTAVMLDYEKALNAIEIISRDLTADGVPGALTNGIGQYVRDVLQAVRHDLSGLAVLLTILRNFDHELTSITKRAVGICKEAVKKVTAEMIKNQIQPPKDWEEIAKRLKKESTNITNLHYPNYGKR